MKMAVSKQTRCWIILPLLLVLLTICALLKSYRLIYLDAAIEYPENYRIVDHGEKNVKLIQKKDNVQVRTSGVVSAYVTVYFELFSYTCIRIEVGVRYQIITDRYRHKRSWYTGNSVVEMERSSVNYMRIQRVHHRPMMQLNPSTVIENNM